MRRWAVSFLPPPVLSRPVSAWPTIRCATRDSLIFGCETQTRAGNSNSAWKNLRHCSVRGILYTRFLTFAPLSAMAGGGAFLVIRRVCVVVRRRRGGPVVLCEYRLDHAHGETNVRRHGVSLQSNLRPGPALLVGRVSGSKRVAGCRRHPMASRCAISESWMSRPTAGPDG